MQETLLVDELELDETIGLDAEQDVTMKDNRNI
jgi:hypothetical protein